MTIPGKYDLGRIQLDDHAGTTRTFLECLLRNKHVLYDWGWHNFHVRPLPFTWDYDKCGYSANEDAQWLDHDPEVLHGLLAPVFEGQWGRSAVDTILRWENSGVKVDIFDTEKFGPENPKEFIESLRQRLKS